MSRQAPTARRTSRLRTRVAVLLPLAACSLWLAASALGLPPFTTGAKSSPPGGTAQAEVYGLAAGCHATYDRVVIRARIGKPGYSVRYVSRIDRDPSGLPLPLAGNARLLVVLRPARGHTAAGRRLIPATLNAGCGNLRQIKVAGDFESVLSLGVGLQRKSGFRVFRLTSPTRIVIDVLH